MLRFGSGAGSSRSPGGRAAAASAVQSEVCRLHFFLFNKVQRTGCWIVQMFKKFIHPSVLNVQAIIKVNEKKLAIPKDSANVKLQQRLQFLSRFYIVLGNYAALMTKCHGFIITCASPMADSAQHCIERWDLAALWVHQKLNCKSDDSSKPSNDSYFNLFVNQLWSFFMQLCFLTYCRTVNIFSQLNQSTFLTNINDTVFMIDNLFPL